MTARLTGISDWYYYWYYDWCYDWYYDWCCCSRKPGFHYRRVRLLRLLTGVPTHLH